MTDHEIRPTVAELRSRMESARTELIRLIDVLDEDTIATARDGNNWTVVDHVTHLTAWERSMVSLLNGRPRYIGLGVDEALYLAGDYDATNAAIQQRAAGIPWVEARAEFDAVHEQMLETLERLSDADLLRPAASFQTPDEEAEPVWPFIAGNTMGHYDEHREWIAEWLPGESSG